MVLEHLMVQINLFGAFDSYASLTSSFSWLQAFYYFILGIYVTAIDHAGTDLFEFATLNLIIGTYLQPFK
jgi:hypothetical protein